MNCPFKQTKYQKHNYGKPNKYNSSIDPSLHCITEPEVPIVHSKDIKAGYQASLTEELLQDSTGSPKCSGRKSKFYNNKKYSRNFNHQMEPASNPFITLNNQKFTSANFKQINSNPYKIKHSEEFYSNETFTKLKEMAFAKDEPVKLNEYSKMKGAKYLAKLKKKKVQLPSNNPIFGNSSENHKKLKFTEEIDVYSHFKNNPLAFFQSLRDDKRNKDDLIFIDKEEFKKTDINKISHKVLKNCNFFQNKNKNSRDQLKMGNGKMMFTNGLSIKEFSKLHNLNP